MYKSTLTFDGTQKLKDITVKSGSYSATYKIGIDDPSGTIPQADCQSEVDMVYNFEFSIIDSDYYIMSVTFKQPIPSTSTTSTSTKAAVWSTAGIILESTGYQPLDLTYAQSPLQFVEKPAYLYGWTDPNANLKTLYTDSTTLTTGMTLYDNTGTDTGLTVGTINQDGSFDINGSMYYCWKLYRLGPSSSPAPFQGNYYCYSTTEEPSVGDLVYTGTSETAEITGYTTGDLQFTQDAEVAHYARYSDYDTTDLNTAIFYENGVVPIDK